MTEARPEPRTTLPDSRKTAPHRAERVGQPSPDDTLEVTLRVRPRQPLPEPGTATPVLTPAEYLERYGADHDDLERIADFAHDHHLSVVQSSPERRTVVLSGALHDMEAAFGATLHLYRPLGSDDQPSAAAQFRGRSGTLSVPSPLAPLIEGVFGLDDRPQAHPQYRYARPPTPEPGTAHPHAFTNGFPVTALTAAYAFPAGTDGSGQTVAIIELGGGYRTADLRAYFRAAGLATPRVTAVSVNGARNRPTGDPGGPDGEVMLDIEVVGASAPGARIVVYFAPNTDAGFLNAVTTAAHDPTHRPSVISISWGAAESNWTTQAMNAMTAAFQEAGLLGVSVFCAAGDDGSSDRVPGGLAHADFPASSPAATGCGGTRLTLQGGLIAMESVWNNGVQQGASGGGISDTYPLPAYQSGAGVPTSANPPHRAGRGVPDVSAVADPQSGYQVRVDGVDTVIGGTSAVAPLWAGLTARLNQALGTRLGFLNPALYAHPEAFHDITVGNNGAYAAGPGWDPCTGLGTPNGEALLQALRRS